MAEASLQDRANHEASHAVVFWWWVNQPDGVEGGTDGSFFEISIESDEKRHGHFDPYGCDSFERDLIGDTARFEQCLAALLAGPVSDELRGQYRRNTTDEQWVKGWLDQLAKDPEADMKSLKAKTAAFLQRPEVRVMVDALADVLLERTTLKGDDAILVMEAARP